MWSNDVLAIDPIALFLRGEALYYWYLRHHPHVPPTTDLQEVLSKVTPEEREFALNRARVLIQYGKAVEEALAGTHLGRAVNR